MLRQDPARIRALLVIVSIFLVAPLHAAAERAAPADTGSAPVSEANDRLFSEWIPRRLAPRVMSPSVLPHWIDGGDRHAHRA